MNHKTTAIIMCTYNGEQYLEEQLNSILCQDGFDYLYISDDCSSDSTPDILNHYSEKDTRVQVTFNKRNLGVKENFNYLLNKTREDYIFLADQDDIWAVNKIHTLLASIKKIESENGKNTPTLVFSDLEVVDYNLKQISNSFYNYEKISPLNISVKRCMVENVAPGCCMVINRALLLKSLPIQSKSIMHDWWLFLVCCYFGRIEFVPNTLVKYRQHSKNQIGVKGFKALSILINLIPFIKELFKNYKRNEIYKYKNQISSFLKIFYDEIDQESKEIMIKFSECVDGNCSLSDLIFLKSAGVVKSSKIKTFGLYLLMFLRRISFIR